MTTINNLPLPTRVYDNYRDFSPKDGSLYIAHSGMEDRSKHFKNLHNKKDKIIECAEVIEEQENAFSIKRNVSSGNETNLIALRSSKQLQAIWPQEKKLVYLDITGLRHHIWIPLIKSALSSKVDLRVIYVEPEAYKSNLTPDEGHGYDLSERNRDIKPIPGFASLSRTDEDFSFIALLGFEGKRAAYMIESIQPINDNIIPVIGIPGFQPDNPFHTYLGNDSILEDTQAWQRVEFADANCPFSLFYLLERVAGEQAATYTKVGMIGTKPHSLGAALFVLKDPAHRELVYDHPIRKSERTSGVGRLLEYNVSEFSSYYA